MSKNSIQDKFINLVDKIKRMEKALLYDSTNELCKSAVAAGYFNKNDVDRLLHLIKMRNMIGHGMAGKIIITLQDLDDLKLYAGIIERAQDKLRSYKELTNTKNISNTNKNYDQIVNLQTEFDCYEILEKSLNTAGIIVENLKNDLLNIFLYCFRNLDLKCAIIVLKKILDSDLDKNNKKNIGNFFCGRIRKLLNGAMFSNDSTEYNLLKNTFDFEGKLEQWNVYLQLDDTHCFRYYDDELMHKILYNYILIEDKKYLKEWKILVKELKNDMESSLYFLGNEALKKEFKAFIKYGA